MYRRMSKTDASFRAMSSRSDDRPLAPAPWLRAPECRELIDRITSRGGEARFVGGCVRDALLDPQGDISDLDVATTLLPEEISNLVDRAIPTGLAHGTITARLGCHMFEVTTLRRDVACDGRHAEVEFTESFEEDAARRDFTINAMSCDIEGHLYDYFGGAADLEAGRLRFVGDPVRRIREDYLRILRFFRFHARFGRSEPEPATLAAIAAETYGLDRLSGERLQTELMRLLAHPHCAPSVRLMEETGVLAAILGEGCDTARLTRLTTLDTGYPEGTALRRLAALLPGDADPSVIAHRLRLSNDDAQRLEHLHRDEVPAPDAPPNAWREAVYRRGRERIRDAALRAAADAGGHKIEGDALTRILELVTTFVPSRFPLTGHDLLARGVEAGPELGALLGQIETWWIDKEFEPSREQCLAELDRRMGEMK